jgi:PAS domain S-box-containing protein
VTASTRDLTDSAPARQRAARLARGYATLSSVDEAIVRIRERRALFEQVCRVLVEQGRMRMAWVGEVDDEGWIIPVAHAGAACGYLDSIRISVLDIPEGRGPTGTAARERHHVFTTDIATDSRMAPWRDAALARGFRSSAAFPLAVEGRCAAVLTAYKSEPAFFDVEEIELFDRMAADLAFALEAMAHDERRREAEAQLRASENELRLRAERLELVHDAVIVREPEESRVKFWNRSAEAIYGFTREEALGRHTHELLATVFPESPEAVYAALAREGRWAGELRHTRKDGEVIVVSSRQALQRDDDGRPIAIIELNSDITERKRAEEELAYTTRLLERTQAISRTGGWEYDVITGKTTWTDEVYRIFGLERRSDPPNPGEAIAAFDWESAPIIDRAFARLVAEGEPYDLELGLIRIDGERIWVRLIGRALIEEGRIVRVSGMIADVTDRRLAEEEIRKLNAELEQRVAARTADLQRANRELETFAYSVSHDLRAPLRAVDGFSKALLEEYRSKLDDEGRHYLERVRAGARRMGNQIDEILQLSRLSRQRFERTEVDISALASEVAGELNEAEPGRRVAVEIEDGLLAEADLGLVRTILENLLGNAYKFTSKTAGPCIRFGAVQQQSVPVYFVTDNGAGFDMAHADRLFHPFHRLHRESEFPGDGIGLATVVRAVQRHGGAIWAEGAVNRGATFHFSLTPGARAPATAATGEDVTPLWQPTDRKEDR